MKILKVLFAIFLLLAIQAPGIALAGEYEDLIKKGDGIYVERQDPAKAGQAIDVYTKASQLDPNRFEAFCRLARAFYWVGRNSPENKQTEIFKQAASFGEKAVKLAPDKAESHYWYGVNLSLWAKTQGGTASLRMVDLIKKEMNAVIAVNPAYDSGGAYMVLGRLYFKLPGFFGGDNDKAISNLKKAIKHGPNRQLTRIYLAEVYLDEGLTKEAAAELEVALSSPCEELAGPECKMWKKRARKLLQEMEKKS